MPPSRNAGVPCKTAYGNRSCKPLDHFRTVHHLNEHIFEVGFADLDFFECTTRVAALRENRLDLVVARQTQQMLAAIAVARVGVDFEWPQLHRQHALGETQE